MTNEKINIAIAEACGWSWEARMKGSIKVWNKPPNYVFYDDELPDYCNDLNAMHEAEESLSEQQRVAFSDNLYDVACNHQVATGKWRYLSLPARQRAEAFLRTIGKWEEDKK